VNIVGWTAVPIDRSAAALAAVAADFGHVFRGKPLGMIRPTSARDVAQAVGEGRASGSKLTLRGTGHSAGGQSLPVESVVIDLSAMNAVGPVDAEAMTVRCEAGATLRQLVAATLPLRLLPRPLTNLLDLSVGGVLGVGGGVGPSSHRYGAIGANVVDMEVVTGDGVLHRCSRSVEPELFQAVLGGLGTCGVIVSAVLRLRPVKPRVRTFYLLYDDLQRWIDDQRLLADAATDAIEGFCSSAPQGLRGVGGKRAGFVQWFFPLHVAIEFDEREPELPDGIAPYRVLAVEDDAIEFFPPRHDARFETMRRIGAWDRPHPYVSAFIDRRSLAEVLPAVLDALPPALGDGYWGGFLFDRQDAPAQLALPTSSDLAFFSVMYPQVPPELLPEALDVHARLAELLTGAGGKRYLADWMGEVDEEGWRAHFGPAYDGWVKARHAFDPDRVFTSALIRDAG
jgi:cytokinin dehydrogenase